MGDTDYAERVRKMDTSDLIACLVSTTALRAAIDPHGIGEALVRAGDPDAERVIEDLAERGRLLVLAIAAELDRRIPIPEEPRACPRCFFVWENCTCQREPTEGGLMPAKSDLTTFDQMMRDYFSPDPPAYVLEARARRRELERTGKRVHVAAHMDNCGSGCRNVGPATLVHDLVIHDCCYECNQLGNIESGALPESLRGADWRRYAGAALERDWSGWCRMWFGITWVRGQGFWRDMDNESGDAHTEGP